MSRVRSSSLALALAYFSSLASAASYIVTVGAGGLLQFDPPTLTAQIGDTITYKFFSKNHAVAQSTFADPCHLQENGIFSGFTPNNSSTIAAPTDFTITINDTTPLWFYCPQTTGNHCQSGMVHSINAPATGNTFAAYQAKAKTAATPSTPPEGTLPVGGLRKLHIDVGLNGETIFSPNNVTELIGTVVEFSYNPKNHSIVQSSFDQPCQPLSGGGFAAPFVPTSETPSGVTFEVTITNPDPVWFYCAQTAESHCQSGMVGSLNAATTGDKTFAAFQALAASAPPSTTVADTPLVGALKINGTFIPEVGSAVLNVTKLDLSLAGYTPPVGVDYPPYIGGMAGGNQPANYHWGTNLTADGVYVLQTLQYIDNFIVTLLLDGHNSLDQGAFAGVYPSSIELTIASLAAQSLIQRRAWTDTLQHFSAVPVSVCNFDLGATLQSVDTWLSTLLAGLQISTGAILDAIALTAVSDPWLTPLLASGLAARTRMSALLNLMQNHVAAAAPREVLVPIELAASYIESNFAAAAGSCEAPPNSSSSTSSTTAATYPTLEITTEIKDPTTTRLTAISITIPSSSTASQSTDGFFIAWLGLWGDLSYTSVDATNNTAAVPDSLSGNVFAVLTNSVDAVAANLSAVSVAGPALLWFGQQWTV
ncbi:hypothetical protein F5Y16DRAFT_413577 [Xylariaceae sp. FL0255]|nr:hypothetical protein F5Y16DRAFT_413577 [Xylariaceae sp. FL0255]